MPELSPFWLVSLVDNNNAAGCCSNGVLPWWRSCWYKYVVTVGIKGAYKGCSRKSTVRYGEQVTWAADASGLEGVMHVHWLDTLSTSIINLVNFGCFFSWSLLLKGWREIWDTPLREKFALPPILPPWDQGCVCLAFVYTFGLSAGSIVIP